MEQPTKEEVEKLRAERVRDLMFNHYQGEIAIDPYVFLCDAYLAQEEELKEVNDRRMELIAMVEQLKAENQALKADIEKHENGYGYLLATGQAEREEMRKRNRRKDQP